MGYDTSPESPPEPSPEPSPETSPEPSPGHLSVPRGRADRRGRGRGRGIGRGRVEVGVEGSPATPGGEEESEWSSTLTDISVEQFDRDTGPSISISSCPVDVFLSFFTPQLIDHIVTESNRYAAACLRVTHQGNGPVPEWSTSAEEIRAYLGFSILMGITKLPDLYDYWSTTDTLHYFPIACRIPRKQILEIKRYLHFTDNDRVIPRGQEGHGRLAKVRPAIELVRKAFLDNYQPHRENAVDEAMVPFKGRSSLKQYVPLKPVRRGFKIWVRADSINGYICDFSVYTGKDGAPVKDLGAKVVKNMQSLLLVEITTFFSTTTSLV